MKVTAVVEVRAGGELVAHRLHGKPVFLKICLTVTCLDEIEGKSPYTARKSSTMGLSLQSRSNIIAHGPEGMISPSLHLSSLKY